MLAVILSMLWHHEREFAYAWSACTISNLSNTCMDSLHTGDLSPQTQFHILCAIKVLFWGQGLLCYFGLPLLSMCLMKLKRQLRIWYHSYDSKHSVMCNQALPCPWGNRVPVKLPSLSWPLGGGGPLLWVASQALQGGEGNLTPWFQMSGLVNMPQTVVKDDNENAGCQSAQHNESIFQNATRGRGSFSKRCGGEKFHVTSSSGSLYNATLLNPSTPWQHNSLTHFLQAVIVAFNCVVVETDMSVTQLHLRRSCSVRCCHSELQGVCSVPPF